MSSHVYTQQKAEPSTAPSFRPVPSRLLQRKCSCGGTPGATGECEQCQKKRLALQGHTENDTEPSEMPPVVHEVLRSPGQPLDSTTRAFMEPRFGHDFSQVRVHTDTNAASSAGMMGAAGYTFGQHIVLGVRPQLSTPLHTRLLLAHELMHVVQQTSSPKWHLLPSQLRLDSNKEAELQADRAARNVVGGSERAFSATQAVKSGLVQTGLWERVKNLFRSEPDDKDVYEGLKEGLERAEQLCKLGAKLTTNSEAAERLTQASGRFGQAARTLDRALSWRNFGRDVLAFTDAIEILNEIDIQENPEAAAAAFGMLFESAGNLGQRLPPGPWTPYFEWIGNAGDFFTNMQRKLDPSRRYIGGPYEELMR